MYLKSSQLPEIITPPSDFTGLDGGRPVCIQQRDLPHWRQEGASYFLTFRMEDSLPRTFWGDWFRHVNQARVQAQSDPGSRGECEQRQRKAMQRLELELDAGHGRCWLRVPEYRRMLGDIVLHFHGERHFMHAFAIMPNHVHAAVQPLPGHPLATLLKSWKSYSAHRINKAAGIRGAFWQRESFDRIIRDADHFRRVIRYILRNPAQAGLGDEEATVWAHPDVVSWQSVA